MGKIFAMYLGHADYLDENANAIRRTLSDIFAQKLEVIDLSSVSSANSGSSASSISSASSLPAIACSSAQAVSCARAARAAGAAGVILVMATWVECDVVMSALKELEGVPMLVYAFPLMEVEGRKESTGAYVSGSMISGVIRRLKLPVDVVLGSWEDPQILKKLQAFAAGAAAFDRLKYSRIGLFGYTSMSIYTGTFDHVLMRYKIGPEVVHMDSYSLIRRAQALLEAEAVGSAQAGACVQTAAGAQIPAAMQAAAGAQTAGQAAGGAQTAGQAAGGAQTAMQAAGGAQTAGQATGAQAAAKAHILAAAEQKLRAVTQIRADVLPDVLQRTLGIYAALQSLCEEHSFDAVNVKCQYEFSKEYKTVPCVALSLLADDGIVASCEGDIPCTVSMLILNALSGQTATYGDSLNRWDNIVEFSPCGFMPFSLGAPGTRVQKFLEHPGFSGIQVSGVMRPEKVTFLRLVEDIGSYHILYGTGQGLPTKERGGCMPALDVQLDGSADKLEQEYAGQHYAIVYGDWSAQVEALARIMQLDVVRV